MTPAEIQNLTTAIVNHRGECVCCNCAPWVGVHATPRQDFNAAPLLTIDPAMPILGACPECGAKYQVPAATAIALLAAYLTPKEPERMRVLRGVCDNEACDDERELTRLGINPTRAVGVGELLGEE